MPLEEGRENKFIFRVCVKFDIFHCSKSTRRKVCAREDVDDDTFTHLDNRYSSESETGFFTQQPIREDLPRNSLAVGRHVKETK
jgi:hypothetical protein